MKFNSLILLLWPPVLYVLQGMFGGQWKEVLIMLMIELGKALIVSHFVRKQKKATFLINVTA